jgi:GGDEF domain-containing protein
VTLLKEQLRWVDVLVQWEADRVLVLLPETGAEAAYRLLRKLAQMIDGNWPAEITDVRVHWGSSTWRRGDDTVRLVRRAEAASLAHSPSWSSGVFRHDP